MFYMFVVSISLSPCYAENKYKINKLVNRKLTKQNHEFFFFDFMKI